MDNTRDLLRRQFSSFSKTSIIELLSTLNVFPENHSQRQRLASALQVAVDMEDTGSNPPIRAADLSTILSTVYVQGTDAWNREDPQETLFTELFLFHGGNHVVFPEVFSDSLNGLRNLADTIFMTENALPAPFKRELFFAISTLLKMSNDAAEKMGYQRYMISPFRHREPVFFPQLTSLQRGIDAVKFSYNQILKPGIPGVSRREAILKFFTNEKRSAAAAANSELEEPIHTKPLYRAGDQLIVINIQGICAALVHFTIVKIHEYKILEAFITEYRQLLQERTRQLLRRIDFEELEGLPPVSASHPLFHLELLYRFDKDKLAYVTLIPDLLNGYNRERFFSGLNEFIPPDDLKRRKTIAKEYAANAYPDHELLFIDLFIPVGREYRIGPDSEDLNLIQLSFSDLRYIMLRESGSDGLGFWRYLLAYREHTEHAPIHAFSFLDRYAFYKDHKDTFYFHDDLRYPSLMIPIGYANDFREEAHSKTDIHLVPLANSLVEVEKRFHHREINIYIPNSLEFLPRQFVAGYPASFWVHVQFRQRSNQILRQTAWMLIESTSYWLWELNADFQTIFSDGRPRVIHYELELLDEDKWNNYNFDREQTAEIVSCLFRFVAKSSHITVLVPFELAYLINGINNDNDRVILRWLILSFNAYLKELRIPGQLNTGELVEKYAPRGKKTMMQGFDTLRNPMLHPHKLPEARFVADFEVEALLNDLGRKAGTNYPIGDITDIKAKNKLCNQVVAYYFTELKSLIALFPYPELLHYVTAINESLWRLKHMTGNKTTSRLACFERIDTMRAEIIEENMEIEGATVALRCLIEIIIAIPPSGSKPINDKDFDRMLALMKEIVTWGTISDELNFGVNEVEMGILASGRVGISKDFLEKSVRPYTTAKKNEEIDQRIVSEETRALISPATDNPKAPIINQQKESAFTAEFGFTWQTYLDLLMTLVDLGFETEDGVMKYEETALVRLIKDRLSLSDEVILSFLTQFSLSSRGKWETLPEGYKLADVYPWRYSRPLSLMRKPIVHMEADGNIFYYWGMRQVLLTYQYLDDLIADGRYSANTPLMKSYISGLLDKKGKKFTADVFQWLNIHADKSRYIIDREVKISEQGKLKAEKNYGDIDILIIDKVRKKIISVECKHVTPARITSEFASELKKFESEWIGKHTKRHKWLNNHLTDLKTIYQLDLETEYEIRSIFLTSEKVPFPFITKNFKNLPFYDFSSWTRDSEVLSNL